ncbi:MAG: hypothetical protein U1F39_09930 [Steroidobacteraceae bacterium]
MSPLWRDEVGLHLSSTLVVINRLKKGMRPQCIAKEAVPVEGGGPGFEPMLRVLDALLEDVRWHGANARVVVADGWARFAIVPWAQRLSEAERQAHAWHVMEQAYGEMQPHWRLALADTGPGNPRLACAMPTVLHDSILESCRKAQLRVCSLQPQLVVAYNCASRDIHSGAGWFVSLASGTLSAAQFGPRGWSQVRALRIGNDWSAELQRLRRFGRLTAQSAEDARVFVDAPVWLQRLIGTSIDGLELLPCQADAPVRGTLQSLVALRALHP